MYVVLKRRALQCCTEGRCVSVVLVETLYTVVLLRCTLLEQLLLTYVL